MKKITEIIQKHKPTIEIREGYKEELEEKINSMDAKNKKKISPFSIPLSIGAIAAAVLILWSIPGINMKKSVQDEAVSPQPLLEKRQASKMSVKTKKTEFKWGTELSADRGAVNSSPLDLQDMMTFNQDLNTEEYTFVEENSFISVAEEPRSTFSIDVDTASYSNVRRYLDRDQLPPVDAVRIEEIINYFDYSYPLPTGEHPFGLYTEVSESPWNRENYLVHIGLKGMDIPESELPPSNLVFLIDVSGSMNSDNKLGLLKKSFEMMVRELDEADRVSIITYAGSAGLVLPSTSAADKETINNALNRLSAGGSTAGGEGIQLAYKVAAENFIKDGNNRVIIATDGDFNVGVSSTGDLTRLIEKKRDTGIFLTVLGFGMGNYKGSRMEMLADKGNGNYAYIDSLREAQKVMVNDLRKNLFVIAKDVKIQVEFNPAAVAEYRLVGYETRMLQNKDFADDRVDAGEIGSGHTVTALYEIVPKGVGEREEEGLRYQDREINTTGQYSGELLNLSLRYKKPSEDSSKLLSLPVMERITPLSETSETFRFSLAAAAYGQLLRESGFNGDMTWEKVYALASGALGADAYGYRQEFTELIKQAEFLHKNKTVSPGE